MSSFREAYPSPIHAELARRDMERDWKALTARWQQYEEFRTLILADLEQEANPVARDPVEKWWPTGPRTVQVVESPRTT